MIEVGSIVAGKYRIEQIIGRGGMGLVAIATHLQLDQRVALKVVLEEIAQDEGIVERFMREARASAKLKTDHVCRVSDVDQLPSGQPFIVMELLHGSDLQKLGRLDISTAATYVLQACVAVAEAHSVGIIHRDLKPANLFLTQRLDGSPLIKVLDFGIAKASDRADLALTQTQALMGSPGYMSPEQLRSARDVDARSDIWALGVILYELTTASLPFIGQTITELAVKVAVDPPRPLPVGYDPAFAAVVLRCLEKDVARRYQSVAELAAALAPFADASSSAATSMIARLSGSRTPVPAPQTAQASAPTAYTQAPSRPPPPVATRSKAPLVIGGLLVVAAAGAVAFALTRGGDAKKPAVVTRPIDAAVIAVDAAPDIAIDAPIDAPLPDAGVAPKPKPTPVVVAKPPPEPPAASLTPADVSRAVHAGDAAINAGDPKGALAAVKAVLAQGLDHPQAARVAAIASCQLHKAGDAQRYFSYVKPASRRTVQQICANNSITLE